MSGARIFPMRRIVIILGVTSVLAGILATAIVRTEPTRLAVHAYTALLGAANRQDIDTARRLCSTRYLRDHDLTPAAEGGLVGLPRNIHPNFQVWRDGQYILICPTNRVGPVYQFVFEKGDWRFDGPVGILRCRGQLVRLPAVPDADQEPAP